MVVLKPFYVIETGTGSITDQLLRPLGQLEGFVRRHCHELIFFLSHVVYRVREYNAKPGFIHGVDAQSVKHAA